MRAGIVAVTVLASGCAYKAGSFSHFKAGFAGQRASLGCLDVAVERRPDLPEGGTVLGYSFGNRCERAARIDLRAVRVEGRTFDGQSVVLTAFDPRGEIRPLLLDGKMAGTEALAYHADARLAEVCVDVAMLARTEQPQWLCFASTVAPPVAPTPSAVAEVAP
jgi:hypothetical protein